MSARAGRTSAIATGIALSVITGGGLWAASSTTYGFTAWTSEQARRLRVAAEGPVLPAAQILVADGSASRLWSANDPSARVFLLNFMYTRCPTLCSVLGNEYLQLQRALTENERDAGVRLLSISFDPEHDTPAALSDYAARHRAEARLWTVAVPTDRQDLRRLLSSAGVVVIRDGLGGYAHNAAIQVVTADGRLVRIFDYDQHLEALAYARGLAQ